MNIITQLNFFEENIFENLGDLERLQRILDTVDDGKLIAKLYKMRGKGRNDWPCEAMWNSFIASFLFEHATTESLLRELRRNKQLRTLCGFTPKSVKQKDGSIKVYLAPSASSYSNFLNNLKQCQEELDEMFEQLVLYMYENLEHFGEILMADGKAIDSFATQQTKNKTSGERGERDADWCKKQYSASGSNGESVMKTKKWFGFRLHLIADATYELPVAFEVTKASNSEQVETTNLIDKIEKVHTEWLDSCKYFLADKGYDSTKLINRLENKGIHSIIDIRNCWKDGEETHQYQDTSLVYNYKGTVWYVQEDGKQIELINKGYDKSTDSLRYGFHPKEHNNSIFENNAN